MSESPPERPIPGEFESKEGPKDTAENADSLAMESWPQPFIRRVGDYELLEEVARGAMGVVYRARQITLDRTVALKMILAGQFASREASLRFRAEAEAAARLHHPNIVAIHETGEFEGQPFYSMNFAEGGNLARLVRERPLAPKQAAALVKTICGAIHHAHEQGVLHRDLKPSNILLDALGQPLVSDFGLAKRVQKDSFLTMTGQVLGSPNFMPPEQAGAKLGKVGRYSDVYGIGGILFYLLTGRPPFVGETVTETLKQVLENEALSPRLLNPAVPIDLATICLKCLQKDGLRRYATAAEVADELERFLRNEPIQARPVGPIEKVWRWSKRQPMVAALGLVTVFLLILVAVGSTVGLLLVEAEQRATRQNLYAADMSLVHQALAQGDVRQARQFLDAHLPVKGARDLRGFEWRYLWENSRGDELATLQESGPSVSFLSFSPNGKWLAGGNKIWDVESVQPQFYLHHEPRFILPTNHLALKFVSDLELLIKTRNRELKRWNLVTGHERLIQQGEEVMACSLSSSGKWLVTGSPEHLSLWDTSDWRLVARSTQAGYISEQWKTLVISPDEKWLITSAGGPFSDNSETRYWSLPTLHQIPLPQPHEKDLISISFSADGREFYTGSANGTLRVWDAQSKTEIISRRAVRLHRSWIADVQPFGQGWITASADRTIRLTDPDNTSSVSFRGHSDEIWSLAVSPDQKIFATGDRTGAIKLWTTQLQRREDGTEALPGGGVRLQPVGVSLDGRILATLTTNRLSFWNLTSRPVEEIESLRWHFPPHQVPQVPFEPCAGDGFAAISPDFKYFAVSTSGKETELWELGSSRRFLLEKGGPVALPLFLPNSETLITTTGTNEVSIWDVRSRQRINRILTNPSFQDTCAPFSLSRNGQFLALSLQNEVAIWNLSTARRKIQFAVPRRLVIALSSDGSLLASGGEDNLIRLYDTGTGAQIGPALEGHVAGIEDLAFSPDDKTLYSGTYDSRLWNLATRRTMIVHEHPSAAVKAFFTNDGGALIVGEIKQQVHIWRAPSFAEIQAAKEL